MKNRSDDRLVNVRDRAFVRALRPVLIAHRGGIVAPQSPENTLLGIRLAALHRFDMVELDVREARDGVPIIFHDGHLGRNVGVNDLPENLTSADLAALRHRASDQHIPTLAEALALCAEARLGVMFDVKHVRNRGHSEGFYERIRRLVDDNGLRSASITISSDPVVREQLGEHCLLTVTAEELGLAVQGERVDLSGRFWFERREFFPEGAMEPLKTNGALVFPAMNTFRYPAHAYMELARRDVEYFERLGADGYQIDSDYEGFFA